MIKDIYFGVQIALLFFAGGFTYDWWYKGALPGIHSALIIIACVMAIYSSVQFYLRIKGKRVIHDEQFKA